MSHAPPAYGLRPLVINTAVFLMSAFSFTRPPPARTFFAFLVAWFVEMRGFPLTIYLLSG